jgi:hypothetical protein
MLSASGEFKESVDKFQEIEDKLLADPEFIKTKSGGSLLCLCTYHIASIAREMQEGELEKEALLRLKKRVYASNGDVVENYSPFVLHFSTNGKTLQDYIELRLQCL